MAIPLIKAKYTEATYSNYKKYEISLYQNSIENYSSFGEHFTKFPQTQNKKKYQDINPSLIYFKSDLKYCRL